MADYGKKIAALRKSKGMTQEDLGKYLHVTYQAVSKWERGEAQPDFTMMLHIAKFFKVPLEYFEDGAELPQVAASEAVEKKKVIGMCTACGRMLEEGDEATTSPKILCKDCHERQQQEPVLVSETMEKKKVIGMCTACGRMLEEGDEATTYPKLVCKDCHERQQHEPVLVSETVEKKKVIGMCTVCGRMLEEGDEAATSPKIVCKECDERQKQAAHKAQKEKERKEAAEAEAAERRKQAWIKEELGKGFDTKLIVALVLAVAAYVLLTVLCFKSDTPELIAVFLLLVPLALFGVTIAVFNFIASLREKDDEGYTRNLSLIVGACFSAVNIVLFLVLYLMMGKFAYYIVFLVVGMLVSFTFVSQFMWGSVLRELFTGGGFTFKIPGIIFALDVDSIILMIVLKIGLGILAIAVFLITTVLCAVISILGSVVTFVPCIIAKSVKDNKTKKSA